MTSGSELPVWNTLVAASREIWRHKGLFIGIVVAMSLAAAVLAPEGPGARRTFYLLALFSLWMWLSNVAFPSKKLETHPSQDDTRSKGPSAHARRLFLFALRALGFVVAHILVVDAPKIILGTNQFSSWATASEIVFFVLAARLILILPASAADEPTSFKQIWHRTEVIWGKLCAVLILACLAGGLVGLAASLFLISAILGMASAAGLSLEFSASQGAGMFAIIITTTTLFVGSCLGLVFKAVSIAAPADAPAVSPG